MQTFNAVHRNFPWQPFLAWLLIFLACIRSYPGTVAQAISLPKKVYNKCPSVFDISFSSITTSDACYSGYSQQLSLSIHLLLWD